MSCPAERHLLVGYLSFGPQLLTSDSLRRADLYAASCPALPNTRERASRGSPASEGRIRIDPPVLLCRPKLITALRKRRASCRQRPEKGGFVSSLLGTPLPCPVRPRDPQIGLVWHTDRGEGHHQCPATRPCINPAQAMCPEGPSSPALQLIRPNRPRRPTRRRLRVHVRHVSYGLPLPPPSESQAQSRPRQRRSLHPGLVNDIERIRVPGNPRAGCPLRVCTHYVRLGDARPGRLARCPSLLIGGRFSSRALPLLVARKLTRSHRLGISFWTTCAYVLHYWLVEVVIGRTSSPLTSPAAGGAGSDVSFSFHGTPWF